MTKKDMLLGEVITQIKAGLQNKGGEVINEASGHVLLHERDEKGVVVQTDAFNVGEVPCSATQYFKREGVVHSHFDRGIGELRRYRIRNERNSLCVINTDSPAVNPFAPPLIASFEDNGQKSEIEFDKQGKITGVEGSVRFAGKKGDRQLIEVNIGRVVSLPPVEEMIARMARNEPFFDDAEAETIAPKGVKARR
jgi:hypothetical protein